MNRRPQLEIVAPNASPEEAAAIVAALEQGVGREADGPGEWGDPHAWAP